MEYVKRQRALEPLPAGPRALHLMVEPPDELALQDTVRLTEEELAIMQGMAWYGMSDEELRERFVCKSSVIVRHRQQCQIKLGYARSMPQVIYRAVRAGLFDLQEGERYMI